MRVKIAYKAFPDSFGPPDSHLYSAMLSVQVALAVPNAPRTKRFEAIIDSGATRTLLHSDFASHLGLDVKSGEVEITQGIGGSEATYLHEIALYLPGGPVTTKVGFKDKLPVAGLLGMSGFFEFFKVSFDPDTLICELDRIYRV
jgi:Aspartyl protease